MSLHLHSYPLFALLSHSQPKGLGVATRTDMASEEYLGLKPCGAGEFVAFVHVHNFCIMLICISADLAFLDLCMKNKTTHIFIIGSYEFCS